jgi:signal transduction histidine kinase
MQVQWADRLEGGLAHLSRGGIDCVLLDLSLPDAHELEGLDRLLGGWPSIPIVVLTGLEDDNTAVQAVHRGAQDYLFKGSATSETLGRAVGYAIERQRLLEELRKALALRDWVLALTAHDLKSPLAAIHLYAESLQTQAAARPPADGLRLVEGLEKIQAAVALMGSVVGDLSDAVRLHMGHALDLHRDVCDVVALCRRVLDARQGTTTRHRLNLSTTLSELPGEWDAERLERVLTNLLDNAIRYSPEGGDVSVELTSEESPSGPWAVIAIRDQGVGIPLADLPHIAQPFYRGGNVRGVMPGTGIGLAGGRGIVEQHGGTIAIDSQEGRGTVVTISLPLHRSPT